MRTIGYIPPRKIDTPQPEPTMPPVNTAEELAVADEQPAVEPAESKTPAQKKKV